MYGDGDGIVNLVTMLAFDEEMCRQPGQKGQFKSIKIENASHMGILMDEWALKRVMQEILEVNQDSS